jgi:integrase
LKLTPEAIRKLTCPPGKRDHLEPVDEQRGLKVRVTETGAKSFLVAYTTRDGVKRKDPIGSCHAVQPADALKAARIILGDVARGGDPWAERKEKAAKARAEAERDRLTLAVLIDSWRELHLARKRERYAREAVRALRVAFARHLDQPAESLNREQIVRILDAVAGAGRLALASRTKAYGQACFQWATKRGLLAVNPFAMLPAIGERPKRERVLSDEELAVIWRAADKAPFGPIVRLLILTGQRRLEVAGLAWAELSKDMSTWTIPGARTKNGAAHIVPISAPAQEILRALPRVGVLAMPGDAGGVYQGWSKAKQRLDAASRVHDWRLHDIRRSLASGLQGLGVRLEVTEAILNHTAGSRAGIVGIYQRHDWAKEKRAALDGWGAHVLAIVEGRAPVENVVQFSGSQENG